MSLEERLVTILHTNGYSNKNDPVFIQSFEVENLKQLGKMIDLPLVQLLDERNKQPYDFIVKGDYRTYGDLTAVKEFTKIAEYADAIGVYKRLILPVDQHNYLQPATSLIKDAHAVGLKVHTWTFRNESQYLALDYQGNYQAEYEQFFQLGIDGVFSDFPDVAVAVRDQVFFN